MRRLVLVGMAAMAACQCPNPSTTEARGTPRLSREVDGVRTPVTEVDFGLVDRTLPVEVPLWLENVGDGRLAFERAESVGGSEVLINGRGSVGAPFSITIPEGGLEPGASVAVSVIFRGSANARETGLVDLFFSSSTIDTPLRLALRAQPDSPCERLRFSGLDFGAVEVGDDVREAFTLTNPTNRPVEVALLNFPTGSAFSPESGITRLSIAPGQSASLAVRFNPLSEGLFLDEVTLVDACGPSPLRLVGTGMRGVLRANPSPLDFGFVLPGASAVKAVTLSNYARGPVPVRDLVTGGLPFAVDGASTVMVPGSSRMPGNGTLVPGTAEVPVRFSPTLLGPAASRLTMATSLARQPQLQVPLTGVGGGPRIEVPATLDLGRVSFRPGGVSGTWAVLPISNRGSAPLDFLMPAAVVQAGNRETSSADLCVGEVVASACQPAAFRTIAPGETLEVVLTVRPSTTQVGRDGTQAWNLQLRSNDPLRPVVTTRVVVRPVVLPPCLATVTPGPLDFGVVSEVLPKERAVRICNIAPVTATGSECLVSRLDVAPGARDTFFLDTPVVDQLIGPGQCLTAVVKARQSGLVPAQPAQVTGALRIAVEPAVPDVPLSATKAAGCLVIDPTPLDFGKMTVGCGAIDRTVRLLNRCLSSTALIGVSLVDDGATGARGPAFSVVTAPNLASLPQCTVGGRTGRCLVPDGVVTMQVRYRATEPGRDLGTLQVSALAPTGGRQHLLAMRGEGVSSTRVTDRLPIGTPEKSDVLLLIDGSGSFEPELPKLVQHIDSLTAWAVDAGVDARIAVTMIGDDSSPTCPTCGYGRFGRTDAGVRFFSPLSPDGPATFAQLSRLFPAGEVEDFDENAINAFAAPRVFDPNDNGGFLRDDASLGLLTIWDIGLLWPAGPAAAPFLASIKGANRQDRLTINLASLGPPPDRCRTPLAPDPLVSMTVGRQANYCAHGMGPALASVAPAVFGHRDRVWLRGTPAPAGITSVSSSGAAIAPTLWRHDAATNTVIIDPSAIPSTVGSTVDVTYDLACLP